ncbi:hydroxymethylglutaryl-CoA lyase [Desulfobulbus alkaliphilus]|uniref:hydroxymethylglutaryl-CoA lyase n=1 Tax=Desulfobulbus alkaliphilus TaxID=869814 RepID=UPI00196337E5|nr:hydroxymethylglutaryl-CoA lyase [Desulfobulbus alkaliphilus]MBM9536659.1 hydroxymethylglutaryl-CoA lyase [Desulfobulbus alkaliphilus]
MFVVLEEELLRDGLQAEGRLFSLTEKLHLARLLIEAGVNRLQIGSFVDPRRVPQMADTDLLAIMVQREYPAVVCTALVLNRKGLERALRCGLTHVSMSVSVADSHSRSNAGLPAARALEVMTDLIAAATAAGLSVRAGVQCAFGCGNEEEVSEAMVVRAVEHMTAAGAMEVNLADTAGAAGPDQVESLVTRIRRLVPAAVLSLHLHGARDQGLANMTAGLAGGVRLFDTVLGGLGGCPFIQGSGGNVATEDAVFLLQQRGYSIAIDGHRLRRAVAHLEHLLGRRLSHTVDRMGAYRYIPGRN